MNKLRLPDGLLGFLSQSKGELAASQPWADALRERRQKDALEIVERELAENPSSADARLAWVALQLDLNDVPLSALTTPLVESLPRAKEDTSLARAALHSLLSLSARLGEKNQLRLGVALVEHANDLAEASNALPAPLRRELHEYSLRFLEEEIARASARRESKDYVSRLERKLEEKRKKTFVDPPDAPAKTPRARKPSLSSKTLFEEALAADTPAATSLDLQPLDLSSGREARESSEKRVPRWAIVSAGIFFVVFGLYRAGALLFTSTSSAEPGLLLAMNTEMLLPARLELPEVALSKRELLDAKFQTINSNLEQIGERVKNIGGRQNDKQPTMEEIAKDPSVDQAALKSDAANALKKDDELVGIEGPDEPKPTPEPKVDPRRVPSLDPNANSHVQVEDLTPNIPRHPDSPMDLKVGPDGRIYGPTTDRDPAVEARLPGAPAQAAQTLDGTPLRSYEVQDFERPQRYKTITATNVFSAPSLLSSTVSRLEPETTVQVVSKMGLWLELRSTQGRPGYIFSQNAVPVD